AEDGIRDFHVTGVQTCALPIFRALQFVQQRRHDARAGRPNGVTEGDSAPVDVELLTVDAELMHPRENDGSECLVRLEEVDVVDEIGRASCREKGERTVDVMR